MFPCPECERLKEEWACTMEQVARFKRQIGGTPSFPDATKLAVLEMAGWKAMYTLDEHCAKHENGKLLTCRAGRLARALV